MTPGADDDGLDPLSSKQLHDLAVHRARRHFDARFYWRLMQYLPMAETAAGKDEDAEGDLEYSLAHSDDSPAGGEGETAALLRPFSPKYLRKPAVPAADLEH